MRISSRSEFLQDPYQVRAMFKIYSSPCRMNWVQCLEFHEILIFADESNIISACSNATIFEWMTRRRSHLAVVNDSANAAYLELHKWYNRNISYKMFLCIVYKSATTHKSLLWPICWTSAQSHPFFKRTKFFAVFLHLKEIIIKIEHCTLYSS